MTAIPFLDADAIFAALSPRQAADAVRAALRAGLDPSGDIPRSRIAVDNGELLVMPSTSDAGAGVKLVTLALQNPARGLPAVQGAYVLFDHDTLAPTAILDGAALTTLRTAAVSTAAVRDALDGIESDVVRVVVFGAGPQGLGHARALRAELGDRLDRIVHLVRSPGRVDLDALDGAGLASIEQAADSLQDAEVVVCATASHLPLFASDAIRVGSVVIAVGANEPDARELDGPLMRQANVIVEDVEQALRECGDVVLAIAEGHLERGDLVTLRQVVTGERDLEPGRTVVFKGAGMSWEDLVVAQAVVAAHLGAAATGS